MNRAPLNRALFAAAAASLLIGTAHAGTISLSGSKLTFVSGSDSDTQINVDPTLNGAVRLSADDDIGCVTATNTHGEVIVDTSPCGSSLDHFTVTVPDHFAINAILQSSGNVTLGSTDADLTVTASGNGDFRAGRVQSLNLVNNGSGDAVFQQIDNSANVMSTSNGDIRIGALRGSLNSRQNGSGDLVIGSVEATAVNTIQTGNGDLVIGKGNIAAMRADISGSGDLVAQATIASADLTATGGGDIKIARVTGPVSRHASGGSSISTNGTGISGSALSKLAHLETMTINVDGKTIHVSPNVPDIDINIPDDLGGGRHHHSSGGGGGGVLHFFAGIAVLFMLYVIWRSVQRRGGFGVVSSQIRAKGGAPGQTTHPGVIAIRDKFNELDARLARLETYVTNREFDLHRKFRELDAKQ